MGKDDKTVLDIINRLTIDNVERDDKYRDSYILSAIVTAQTVGKYDLSSETLKKLGKFTIIILNFEIYMKHLI